MCCCMHNADAACMNKHDQDLGTLHDSHRACTVHSHRRFQQESLTWTRAPASHRSERALRPASTTCARNAASAARWPPLEAASAASAVSLGAAVATASSRFSREHRGLASSCSSRMPCRHCSSSRTATRVSCGTAPVAVHFCLSVLYVSSLT